MQGAFKEFLRWINLEKSIFFGAALWLLVTGVRYQGAPVAGEWGPPRVLDSPPDHYPVNLQPPPPISEFLAGARASPFAEEERRAIVGRGGLPTWRPPERVTSTGAGAAPPPKPSPVPPRPKPVVRLNIADIDAAKPKPYELPVRLAGRLQVGHTSGRTIFVGKEDGQHFAVKEGEEIPGLGVKVIRATKNIVIVENDKGKRFRLDDLLRARAEGGGGGE